MKQAWALHGVKLASRGWASPQFSVGARGRYFHSQGRCGQKSKLQILQTLVQDSVATFHYHLWRPAQPPPSPCPPGCSPPAPAPAAPDSPRAASQSASRRSAPGLPKLAAPCTCRQHWRCRSMLSKNTPSAHSNRRSSAASPQSTARTLPATWQRGGSAGAQQFVGPAACMGVAGPATQSTKMFHRTKLPAAGTPHPPACSSPAAL